MTRAIVLALLLLSLATPVWAEADEEPPPVEVEQVVQPLTIPELIDAAAYRWGVSAARMRCIAFRESGFNPYAISPWGHVGLWQWDWRTWEWASRQAGYAGASPFDPWASTEVALWVITHPLQGGGWGHWSTARWC